LKSYLSKYFQDYGKLSIELFGTGEITREDSQRNTCNFCAMQFSNGDTYLAVDSMGSGSLKEFDRKFAFRGVTKTGSIVIVNPQDVDFLLHMCLGSTFIIIYLIHLFTVETPNKTPIRRINFGLTNFLFTGNNPHGENLILNLKNLDPISIQRLPDYTAIIERLKNGKTIDVTSELIIPLNGTETIENIIERCNEICCLLSICRGSKIFWTYYHCFNEHGDLVSQTYCDTVTRPLSELPELISSKPRGVTATIKFLENAYVTLLENAILRKYLLRFSNVFIEAREGRSFIESRGVRIVVVIEMLNKYVLEDPRFEISEDILDSSAKQDLKKIIKECSEVIAEQIQDSDTIRLFNRWNLPTSDAIEAQNKVFNNRADLIINLKGINHTPFKKLVIRLCEKINLNATPDEIQWFVCCRNTLIHTGKYYSDSKGDHATHQEYLFLVNFLDKIFLKLYNYSGEYNNYRKWGSSLEDTI